MTARRPVITGVGVIGAIGVGVPAVWDALRRGEDGLSPLSLFPSPRYRGLPVGEARIEVDRAAAGFRGSRTDKLCWIAASEAFGQAVEGGGARPDPARFGVMLGSTVGGMRGSERVLQRLLKEGRRRFGPTRFHEPAGATDAVAGRLGALGPCGTYSTACSAGAMAILAAAETIGRGEADLILAGAGDCLSRLTLNGFGSLLLLDPEGCRPFDVRRKGISLGEGAAVLALESEASARRRGARILARLTGWGASCDAHHATAPDPEGRGAIAAIRAALAGAGRDAAEVDFISAHGTATPDNDAMEAGAMKAVFGAALPPFASWKRSFGHTLAASGAIEAVMCVASLQAGELAPSAGCGEPDPGLGVEPVLVSERRSLSVMLSNSFGFGGNNVALVIEQPDQPDASVRGAEDLRPEIRSAFEFAVLGEGVISASGDSQEAVARAFRDGVEPESGKGIACGDFETEPFVPPAQRRRMSRLQQMTSVAAGRALRGRNLAATPPERRCIVVGTGLGALGDSIAFLENLIERDEAAPRPALFANSVHNSLASRLAIDLGMTGLNSTPVHREISFELSLAMGCAELGEGRADIALVGAADERNARADEIFARWSRCGPVPNLVEGEGCAMFALGRPDDPGASSPRVLMPRLGRLRRSGGGIDVAAEADWLLESLEAAGVASLELDFLLTGIGGDQALDRAYRDVAKALSERTGRSLAAGGYKHKCGEFRSASGFGFLTAVGLVQGVIRPGDCLLPGDRHAVNAGPCRTAALLTWSSHGAKALTILRA